MLSYVMLLREYPTTCLFDILCRIENENQLIRFEVASDWDCSIHQSVIVYWSGNWRMASLS